MRASKLTHLFMLLVLFMELLDPSTNFVRAYVSKSSASLSKGHHLFKKARLSIDAISKKENGNEQRESDSDANEDNLIHDCSGICSYEVEIPLIDALAPTAFIATYWDQFAPDILDPPKLA
jgi:hypothetical protein